MLAPSLTLSALDSIFKMRRHLCERGESIPTRQPMKERMDQIDSRAADKNPAAVYRAALAKARQYRDLPGPGAGPAMRAVRSSFLSTQGEGIS